MNPTFYLAVFIIAALLLFLIAISWISSYRKKERHKKLMKEFDDLVIADKLTIDKKQTLNKNIIGIDRVNMKLVFIDHSKDPKQTYLISLNDLASCSLKKKRHTVKGHISEIFLRLAFKQPGESVVRLPFYNARVDDLIKMMRLSKKASYWEKTINLFREEIPLEEYAGEN